VVGSLVGILVSFFFVIDIASKEALRIPGFIVCNPHVTKMGRQQAGFESSISWMMAMADMGGSFGGESLTSFSSSLGLKLQAVAHLFSFVGLIGLFFSRCSFPSMTTTTTTTTCYPL